METLLNRHWHHLPAADVLRLLGSDPQHGLDRFEAERRYDHFGPNRLTAREKEGPLRRFLLQFHQPLIYILIAAAVVTLALQEWVDSGVIFGVVLTNAFIGFLQESKAVKAIAALARTMRTETTVVRGGEEKRLSAQDVVPGDVVLLQSGDKVPADMRLVRVRSLQVDESALTGESLPAQKAEQDLPEGTLLANRQNMAFASTLVTYGQATGVVTATGDRTEVGHISEMISTAETLQTPLTRKIGQFSHILLYAILALAGLTFLIGFLRGEAAMEMFMAAVALSVGAIPEGLPAALTITLAIGVSRLARRRAVIRKLPAVETLGSTTVICTDKTGTLTQNQMTVQEILAGGESYRVTGVGFAPEGTIEAGDGDGAKTASLALAECLRAGLLCNDSAVVRGEGRWTARGDPTEAALLVAGQKGGLDRDAERRGFLRLDAVPFESEHQYMATLHRVTASDARIAYVKGAVEAVLRRCSAGTDRHGSRTELDEPAIQRSVEALGSQGLRVLALASKPMPAAAEQICHADVDSDLTFLGLQAMIDPPRPEVIDAIAKCTSAGISVKMITGDHPATAAAIARQIGVGGTATDNKGLPGVMTGADIATLSDGDLIGWAESVAVFARVSPQQKLRLVEALQARRHVVAMTGDGVNDAPALKRADIGVAMGITGTDVSKEAADMVLTDDNFATIEAAVEEGRGVFDNLTKFIVWTLPTNLGEGLVILAAIIVGTTLPILPIQILWINMTTAVLLGLMLAFEPKEPGIMERPPRAPKTPILTRHLLSRIALVGALLLGGAFGLFQWELATGATVAEARTVAVNVFVMVQLFYLFNCRSLSQSMWRLGVFSNRWLFGGGVVMLALQLVYTYVPTMHRLFHSDAIGLMAWGRILMVSIVAHIIVGIEKYLRRCAAAEESAPHRGGRSGLLHDGA